MTWRPSHVLLRSGLFSAAAALVAVLTGRADLLVLAVGFAVHAVVAIPLRPGEDPRARSRLARDTVREGQGTRVRIVLEGAGGVEFAGAALLAHPWIAYHPPDGVLAHTAEVPSGTVAMVAEVASLRWGRREAGGALVSAHSRWGGFCWGQADLPATPFTTLPVPGPFASAVHAPHPIGLVGTHPSGRLGDGSEFAGIRPFAAGDRLRRIHWRVSLRTGALHVTGTVAEQDASVLLLVDSGVEIGASGGIRGAESSLDIAVRAAGAVAEHYLRNGDRVGLRVLGSTRYNALPTSAGGRHLRRLLDTLARITPGESRHVDPTRLRFQVPAGAVLLVFSPMLSDAVVAATATLARRGLSVVVVDTLPAHLDQREDTATERLAWRLRSLERDGLLARVTRLGIPVVAWRGPGTLDEVLRGLGRRAARPSLGRR